MTHTSDPDSPRPRSPLEFPDGLTVDERAERWAEVLAHEERLTDTALDAALFADAAEPRDLLSRPPRAPGATRAVC